MYISDDKRLVSFQRRRIRGNANTRASNLREAISPASGKSITAQGWQQDTCDS
jgi:hypothetical protein